MSLLKNNDTASVMLKILSIGFTVELVLMQSLPRFLHGSTANFFDSALDAGLLTGLMSPFIWWFVVRPIHINAQNNISSAENRLQQAMRDWEESFNTIDDMITVHDADFNIIRANKAAQTILGLPAMEHPGVKCFKHYHGTAGPPQNCPSCQCLANGKQCLTELFEPHLNMHLEIRAIPRINADGKLAGLIHIVRDITEHKKLEAQLRHAQKMDAIGTLSGGIAHDFNNILTAIIGYANILKLKLKADDPMRPHVDQILASTERATSLTQSLLAFSRKVVTSMKPINLNETVERADKLLRRLIGETIDLKTSLFSGNTPVVADAGQIEQVLMNLVTNSRDAMLNGGTITITTGVTELGKDFLRTYGYGKPGTYVTITVTDTGTGMSEGIVDRIFEPFFTTKDVGRGTGLGLSIVYGIIKSHHGYINCASTPGNGTTFTIYLPLSNRSASGQETKSFPVPRGGSETVLLAEDDAEVRQLTKTFLQDFGYTIVEAEDGQAAIRKFLEHRDAVRLLLLDVVMPNKNGKDAHNEIRNIAPGIKTLFMSGHAANTIAKHRITEEGLDLLLKPVSPEVLLTKVREVLDR